MPLDIIIAPLCRIGGQDQPSFPGLMAAAPPRQAARGRDQDRLIVHLQLAGQAVLSSGEVVQAASSAARAFYATPGTITSALRTAAETLNQHLHGRNLASQAQGVYAFGILALAAFRESQLTLLLSGPMQAFVSTTSGSRRIFDSLSGRGLGLGSSTPHYFSRVDLHVADRVLLCSEQPPEWGSPLHGATPAAIEETRQRLMAATKQDLNALLLEATEGVGALRVLRLPSGARELPKTASDAHPASHRGSLPEAAERGGSRRSPATSQRPREGSLAWATDPEQSDSAAPSAYAIPPRRNADLPEPVVSSQVEAPREMSGSPIPSALSGGQRTAGLPFIGLGRQLARRILQAMHVVRQGGGVLGAGLQNLLPGPLASSSQNPGAPAPSAMMFIAVLVPLVVVTIASAVYFRYGRSVQYEQYLVQAREARAQAVSLSDAVAQREAWQRTLFYLDGAEDSNQSDETRALRVEAQGKLDQLLGIVRLNYEPGLTRSLGVQIGRLTAGENDVYLLDAQRGAVVLLALSESGLGLDAAFNCGPGTYGPYTVGPLVDILALPAMNTLGATMLGVDAAGVLLYCAPGQVAQAVPLATPDTGWGRVRSIALDGGNLYVLDAQSHAVWVYAGDDGAFVDRPYFFFGSQIPELEDAIDLAVSGDDLYVLHSDGRLSTCSYSRIESVPTRCIDPAVLANPLAAYRDQDLFAQAHFTQMMFSPAPDSTLLLLDADNQGVFRFNARSLELQAQLRPLAGQANRMPSGEVSAMGVGPNQVLYLAIRDRLYLAEGAP